MVSSRSALLILASGLLAVGAAVFGCADPEGEFDAFTQRYASKGSTTTSGTGGAGGSAACVLPEAGAVDGDYFMALSVSQFPDRPVVFLAQVTTTAMGDGLGLTMTLQALSAEDRRTPVGNSAEVGPYQVDADGRFVADFPEMDIVGEANPITGTDIVADATLTGTLCDPGDFVCGDVTGTAMASITLNLEGSTFTMQKITDPQMYPEAVINCAGEVAPLE